MSEETQNRQVTYVVENTLDLAAAVNEALRQIDLKFLPLVLDVEVAEVPNTGLTDGDAYLLTDGRLARYVSEGDFWEYAYPEHVQVVLNKADGSLYVWGFGSPGIWLSAGAGSSGAAVVTYAGTSLAALAADAGAYTRFTSGAPAYVFDAAQSYPVGREFHGRHAGSGSPLTNLEIQATGGMVINAPYGGTLFIPPGGTFTVKIVGTNQADLFGVTVPA